MKAELEEKNELLAAKDARLAVMGEALEAVIGAHRTEYLDISDRAFVEKYTAALRQARQALSAASKVGKATSHLETFRGHICKEN